MIKKESCHFVSNAEICASVVKDYQQTLCSLVLQSYWLPSVPYFYNTFNRLAKSREQMKSLCLQGQSFNRFVCNLQTWRHIGAVSVDTL